MISVQEAIKTVRENTAISKVSTFPLSEAAGHTLAEDIYAGLDIPAFPQSSMDGYAFSFQGWQEHPSLLVKGEIAAGDAPGPLESKAVAVRIFTGAVVPEGADSVIEQEKVTVDNGQLTIIRTDIAAGHNVRPQGSEIGKGALALAKGTLLTPAAIGFLAGIGVAAVPVFAPPRITIIVTGKELQTPGLPLAQGQVYESNATMLVAALRQINLTNVQVFKVEDVLESVVDQLRNALTISDIVLLTGGISAGDYDFVLRAAEICGVTQHFYKVRQKPGKPLYFGSKDQKLVFGLPGNPASVLTCYYQYVLEALSIYTQRELALPVRRVPLAVALQKNTVFTQFLKGTYDGTSVKPLTGQESYRLSSYAVANCLIVLGEEETSFPENKIVDIQLLPHYG